MATPKRKRQRLDDITECPICHETLTDPKVLPCIHPFCLKCLQTYSKDKKAGDEVSCPMCRTNFVVPQERSLMVFLTTTSSISYFLSVHYQTERSSTGLPYCDQCVGIGNEIKATSYCPECTEKLCETCSNCHKSSKYTKDHQIGSIRDKKPEELGGRVISYCKQHPLERIKLYCYDCKTVSCLMCHATTHTKHKCRAIDQSTDECRAQLSDDIRKVSSCIEQSQGKIRNIETDKLKIMLNKRLPLKERC